MFPPLPEKSPYDKPQRRLSAGIYHGVRYTQPKGVGVPHRGLMNLAIEQGQLFQVRRASRVVQFASLSFDASLAEIIVALCAGAQLVFLPADT